MVAQLLRPLCHSPQGVNCEMNFDDCASNPCDDGICRDGINRYDCICKPGFTGDGWMELFLGVGGRRLGKEDLIFWLQHWIKW